MSNTGFVVVAVVHEVKVAAASVIIFKLKFKIFRNRKRRTRRKITNRKERVR